MVPTYHLLNTLGIRKEAITSNHDTTTLKTHLKNLLNDRGKNSLIRQAVLQLWKSITPLDGLRLEMPSKL
jgi:hypothetical protein